MLLARDGMTENVVFFWRWAAATLLHALIVAAIFAGTASAQAQDNERAPVYLAGSGNVTLDQQVEINQQVARSLNIPLASREQILESVELQLKNTGGQGDE